MRFWLKNEGRTASQTSSALSNILKGFTKMLTAWNNAAKKMEFDFAGRLTVQFSDMQTIGQWLKMKMCSITFCLLLCLSCCCVIASLGHMSLKALQCKCAIGIFLETLCDAEIQNTCSFMFSIWKSVIVTKNYKGIKISLKFVGLYYEKCN